MWPSVLLSRELVSLQMQVDGDGHFPAALAIALAKVLAWVCGIEARTVQASAPNGGKRC
jgi:hypothetical protein